MGIWRPCSRRTNTAVFNLRLPLFPSDRTDLRNHPQGRRTRIYPKLTAPRGGCLSNGAAAPASGDTNVPPRHYDITQHRHSISPISSLVFRLATLLIITRPFNIYIHTYAHLRVSVLFSLIITIMDRRAQALFSNMSPTSQT